jgi:hypothetical protein
MEIPAICQKADGFIPTIINTLHGNGEVARFNLSRIAAALSSFSDARVRFAESECRQDQNGLGAEVATELRTMWLI